MTVCTHYTQRYSMLQPFWPERPWLSTTLHCTEIDKVFYLFSCSLLLQRFWREIRSWISNSALIWTRYFLFIFLLLGNGIFLVFFDIYPIVPPAPAFLHSFLLLVIVVKGKDPKHQTYFYSGTGIFLMFFDIYPIVPPAPAFLHSFLLLVIVVKGKDPKHQTYFYTGTGIFLMFFDIHPIVPHTPALLHSFLSLVIVVKGKDPKRQTYFYSGTGIFYVLRYLSDSTSRTSIFAQFSLVLVTFDANWTS